MPVVTSQTIHNQANNTECLSSRRTVPVVRPFWSSFLTALRCWGCSCDVMNYNASHIRRLHSLTF